MERALESKKRVAYFEYDYAKHGGAAGAISLYGSGIPKGAVVNNGIIHVRTAVTGGTGATVTLGVIAASDVKNGATAGSLGANALVPVKAVGTAATSFRVTAAKNALTMTVATGLTAGKFTVALDYWVTD